MAEWTREAEQRLEHYLAHVHTLFADRGEEAEEIVAGLRTHIREDADRMGGAMVTPEQVERAIRSIGTPEEMADWNRLEPAVTSQPTGKGGIGRPRNNCCSRATIYCRDSAKRQARSAPVFLLAFGGGTERAGRRWKLHPGGVPARSQGLRRLRRNPWTNAATGSTPEGGCSTRTMGGGAATPFGG